MDKNQNDSVTAFPAVVIGIVGLTIILAQKKRITTLKGDLRTQKAVTEVWKHTYKRAASIMSTQQRFALYKDTVTDVQFLNITRDF